jgi:hypothetical protein
MVQIEDAVPECTVTRDNNETATRRLIASSTVVEKFETVKLLAAARWSSVNLYQYEIAVYDEMEGGNWN